MAYNEGAIDMNTSIEVIERNQDDIEVRHHWFWGRLIIDIGEGSTIIINAPGHHENPKEVGCRKHAVDCHAEGSPACDIYDPGGE